MTAYTFQQLINFTRTTSGTFVGSNGLVQTTPQSRNLVLWTQEIDNGYWNKLSGGVAASATTFNFASTSGSGFENSSAATVSAGTSVVASFLASGSGTIQIGIVDASGAFGGTYATVVLTATPTRYSVQRTLVDNNCLLRVRNTSGVAVTGATCTQLQLEVGSVASDYTRNVGGLFPPRFDYDPVTLAPRGILIEEQRTNLQIYSEQFEVAPWVRTNLSTVTANSSAAPNGTMTADLLVSAVGAGITGIAITSFSFSALTYTQSVFVKAATGVRYIQLLYTSGTTSSDYANFDLQTGTVAGGVYSSASMTNFGNGWYRISMTSIATAFTSGVWIIAVPAANSVRGAAYTGNGTDSFLVWGAQLEAGAFATSYIPTVASQVTRTADQASIVAPMFAPWYNQTAGTFVFEGTALAASGFAWPLSASAGSAANAVSMYRSGAFVAGFIASSGTTQLEITSSPVVANVPYKAAVTAETNNGNFSFNGNIGTNDTTITMPTVSRLSLGANAAGSAEFLNGHIRRITFYPVRLSNTQLQALTA